MVRLFVLLAVVLPVAALGLAVWAVVSIARTTMASAATVLWVLAALLLPLLGPILWFAIGRRSVKA
ncbi:PLDc N-terminal domain-containing protein [Diaminobutyricimonas sp. TR449]|uniref:PLDc N-terminal domain-containing protein n=1 Tax=Diaminobutyricimonas sp. TR449 TaxID=2708076 RepID=UPI001421DD4E|nr:PLDc N-terminal domain-containing protein [Diaminobutyricimonas sp. TR449]